MKVRLAGSRRRVVFDMWNVLVALMLLGAGALSSSGSIGLLVGEPYGRFGFFNPTGHAAVYLSHVCAETPVKLRMCGPGEPGVVISRYNRIAGKDWIAVPLIPYLYAVERLDEVPESATAADVAMLRDRYRRSHLRDLVPDAPDGGMPKGDWIQLVGSAYDRNLYGFVLETRPEDDERLIEHLNARPNERRFQLFYRNCADFAREIVNFYYPGTVRRSILGDFGITTPKHAAKRVARFAEREPELSLGAFVVPQIPGGRSSTRIRGVNESLIWSKKYAAPLVLFQPWVAASAALGYLVAGRFNPQKKSPQTCEPGTIEACARQWQNAAQMIPVGAEDAPPLDPSLEGGGPRTPAADDTLESAHSIDHAGAVPMGIPEPPAD